MWEVSLSGVFHDGDVLTITVTAEDADGNCVSDMLDVTVAVPQPSTGADGPQRQKADTPTPVAILSCLAENGREAFK